MENVQLNLKGCEETKTKYFDVYFDSFEFCVSMLAWCMIVLISLHV